VLIDYQEPALDPAIGEALDAYVAARRIEIGAADP
jgi:trimethylamine:corrinoid methyltransferase-like protein